MLSIQQACEVQYSELENLKTAFSFKDKSVDEAFYKFVTNEDSIFKELHLSLKIKFLKGILDKTVHNLQVGETCAHTIEKSELYKGKVVTYYAPFDKCDRVEDYKVAREYFEGVFKD